MNKKIKEIEDCFSDDGDNWQFKSVHNEDKDFIIEYFKQMQNDIVEIRDYVMENGALPNSPLIKLINSKIPHNED